MDENAWIPPHRVLGIDEDADARTIRKAYALKLRTVRPDEDPVGFQRLVEARDHMLRWVDVPRSDDVDETSANDNAPSEPALEAQPLRPLNVVVPLDVPSLLPPSLAPAATPLCVVTPQPESVDRGSEPLPATVDDVLHVLLAFDPQTHVSRRDVEALFAELPAGALRWVEDDVIESLADVARRLEREPFPDAVIEAYEVAFVRLADIFDWEQRDRAIHQALSSDDAHIFFVVLGRALRRHVPGYAGRYARPRPAPVERSEPQRLMSWRSAWAWVFIVMLVIQLARCVR